MPIRLVAIDVDGTLVGSDLRIGARDADAIRDAVGRGVTISLATGRLFAAAKPFADALGLRSPVIALNGASIYGMQRDEPQLLASTPLARGVAVRAFDALKRAGFHLQLYYDDRLYIDERNERAESYIRISQVEPVIVDDLRELLSSRIPDAPGPMKVLGIASPEEVLSYIPVLGAELAGAANVFRSQPPFLEVTDPKAHKGNALRWIARFLNVEESETAAIGDSDNDVPMFEAAGISFAVANATEPARNAATKIVARQDAGGVAEALEFVSHELARRHS